MSAMYNFDHIIDRRGTDSLKWAVYQDRDILPMWVADMDFAAPPEVIHALHQRVDHGIFGYGHPPQELVQTVVAMLADTYQWQVKPEWIVWLPGLVSGLNIACRAVGEMGDDVMTNTPVYPPFLSAPKLSQRNLITTELIRCKQQGWTFDFDAMETAVTARTGLFILCNPHNPTGRIYTQGELSQLLAFCRRHGLIVCSDEIHCQLILSAQKKHLPFAGLGEDYAQCSITLMAPSKTFNIPGLACSFAVIPDATLRRSFSRAKYGIVPEVNVLGYAAALAAYQSGGPWLAQLLQYLRGNRDLVSAAVKKMPGLEMDPVDATYLAWINTRSSGIENPVRFFEAAGVGLSDGNDFGAPGYVRLNFGSPRATLVEALRRMQKALEKRSQ